MGAHRGIRDESDWLTVIFPSEIDGHVTDEQLPKHEMNMLPRKL